MSDLGKTNAEWLTFMRKQSFFARLWRELEDVYRRLTLERVQIRNEGDVNANFTGGTLSGVHYGTNTNEAGELFVRVTGGPTYTVSLYTATGASGLVAQGTGTASSTVVLTEQNSSGMTGTAVLAASVTVDTSDANVWRVFVDKKLEQLKLWPSDGDAKDALGRSIADQTQAAAAAAILSAQSAVIDGWRQWATSRGPNNEIAQGNDFVGRQLTTLFSEGRDVDASGNVSRPVSGFLVELDQGMEDETTGSTQTIIKREPATVSTITFDANNDGQGTVSSFTPGQNSPIGKWKFDCTTGLGNDGGGSEEFSGTFVSTEDNRTIGMTGLRVKQSYELPSGGGSITLDRTRTKSGDASNLNVGAASTFSETGENETNTDGGVLYGEVEANGSNWDISFYSNSGRTDLVAKATNVVTAATNQIASSQRGSGLQVTFDVGSAPVDTSTFSIDLNFFSIGTGTPQVPDRFEFETTLTSSGKMSRILALALRAELNGATSGSEQLDDDALGAVNTFVPYLVEDV